MYKRNRKAERDRADMDASCIYKEICNYAQACSVLIHAAITKTVKSGQAAEETKLFCCSGITQSDWMDSAVQPFHNQALMEKHDSAFIGSIKKNSLYNQYSLFLRPPQ